MNNMNFDFKKRKTSERSCFLCQKDMVVCDEKTPCSRCIYKGVPHMCYSTSVASKPTSTNNPFLSSHNIFNNNNSNNNNNVNNNGNNGNNNINNNNNNNNNNKGTKLNNSNSSPVNNNNNSNNNNNFNNSSSDMKLLISEIRELKDGQKKIYDELIYLKEKNEKLESINESLLSKLSLLLTTNENNNTISNRLQSQHHSIHTDSSISYPKGFSEMVEYQNPKSIFIVIDLQKNPPTVINCSKSFGQLLGYTQNELIGLPWTQIIHPSSIENATNIFNQRTSSQAKGSIEITQVYKHRDGAVFTTLDTHTLFFDSDGRPISDIVIINLINPDVVDVFKNPSIKYLKNSSSASIALMDDSSPPTTPLYSNQNNNNNHKTTTTTTTSQQPYLSHISPIVEETPQSTPASQWMSSTDHIYSLPSPTPTTSSSTTTTTSTTKSPVPIIDNNSLMNDNTNSTIMTHEIINDNNNNNNSINNNNNNNINNDNINTFTNNLNISNPAIFTPIHNIITNEMINQDYSQNLYPNNNLDFLDGFQNSHTTNPNNMNLWDFDATQWVDPNSMNNITTDNENNNNNNNSNNSSNNNNNNNNNNNT